ncbi:Dual specificity protein phosphatase 8 [Lamellibrachia satsuma]|nr:Dual specificity protein phosphatase 8 [Lamellibrachia satsuma]
MACAVPWKMIAVGDLANILHIGDEEVLIIDSRSFLEYNSCHIVDSVNVCCSKLVKRRLQNGKVLVTELLSQACHHIKLVPRSRIVVYDQCTSDPLVLSSDCFLSVLLHRLVSVFFSIELLRDITLVCAPCGRALVYAPCGRALVYAPCGRALRGSSGDHRMTTVSPSSDLKKIADSS